MREQEEVNELGEKENLEEVIMAIDMRDRGTIGCCYYAAAGEALYMMADVKSAGLEVIDSCTFVRISSVSPSPNSQRSSEGQDRANCDTAIDESRRTS